MVVIGGGLTGTTKLLFMLSLTNEMNDIIGRMDGDIFPRLQKKAYNLDAKDELKTFLKGNSTLVNVSGMNRMIYYDSAKRIGVFFIKSLPAKPLHWELMSLHFICLTLKNLKQTTFK
ncbi:MAG: hypothetical protein WCK78_17785 [Paludibacter sp.]